MPADPYSRLLTLMLPFHNRFRTSYATIQGTLRSPQIQALPHRQLELLLHQTLNLTHHLDTHHSIEEAYIFPILATRMPQFDTGKDQGHIKEHERMHQSLEKVRDYARSVERSLRGSQGRKAISEGAGSPLSGSQDDDETEEPKRKPWPNSIFDSDRFKTLIDELGATLFPHLEAEEDSLRPSKIKDAGFTPEELARIMV